MLDTEFLIILLTFAFVALSARTIGQWVAYIKLPLITGYILAGALAGPFVLELLPAERLHDLVFVDQVSLAFIAFAAGSELHLPELRGRYKSIAWVTTSLVVSISVLGVLAVFLLTPYIPFAQDFGTRSRFAIALMAATILIARSPSSAIAIINELRARGPFTKTALSVTVVMDVVVIVLFTVAISLADALLTNLGFNISSLLLLVGELGFALVLGLLCSRLLRVVLSFHVDWRIKAALLLLIGYAVFILAHEIRAVSHEHLSFEILIEPILVCMIASFAVINYSPHRDEFIGVLRSIGPTIFVAFFLFTGASLSLDTLATILPFTLAFFFIRAIAIGAGAFLGGVLAGDPMIHNRVAWMAYITQAGVSLGLSREVADKFPSFGEEFATLMISVIVLNELLGPPFFKFAIKYVGEAHVKGSATLDEVRDVIIVGIENQSRALAQQLSKHNWQVTLVDTDKNHVSQGTDGDVQEVYVPAISRESLQSVAGAGMDAVVAMLDDDTENLRLCELVYELYGTPRMVVRLNEFSHLESFRAIGAVVVNPSSAMVHLLDSTVRAPQMASLLLLDKPQTEVIQVTVTAPDVDGLHIRDLIFPNDVLVMGIKRDGHSIVPHGYTAIRLNDEVTLIGSAKSLDEVTLKLGY